MIKEALANAGMSQVKCAELTGITQSTISGYARGMKISAEHAVKLHDVLKIPLHEMRGDLWPEPKRERMK